MKRKRGIYFSNVKKVAELTKSSPSEGRGGGWRRVRTDKKGKTKSLLR